MAFAASTAARTAWFCRRWVPLSDERVWARREEAEPKIHTARNALARISAQVYMPLTVELCHRSAMRQVACGLDDVRSAGPEVAGKNLRRISAQPVVDDLGIDGAEIRFVVHVVAAVFERRTAAVRIERRRRAVEAALHRAAKRQHDAGGAMVGAEASVFLNAPAELGKLQDHRLRQQSLIAEIVVEGKQAIVER